MSSGLYDLIIRNHTPEAAPAAHRGPAFLPYHREYIKQVPQPANSVHKHGAARANIFAMGGANDPPNTTFRKGPPSVNSKTFRNGACMARLASTSRRTCQSTPTQLTSAPHPSVSGRGMTHPVAHPPSSGRAGAATNGSVGGAAVLGLEPRRAAAEPGRLSPLQLRFCRRCDGRRSDGRTIRCLDSPTDLSLPISG